MAKKILQRIDGIGIEHCCGVYDGQSVSSVNGSYHTNAVDLEMMKLPVNGFCGCVLPPHIMPIHLICLVIVKDCFVDMLKMFSKWRVLRK